MATFVIRSLDLGPTDFGGQLPVRANITRQIPGPDRDDYLVSILERPIKYHYPAAFSTTRAQHAFLATDEDGPFLWVYAIVVCARLVGTRFHARMRSMPINIAFVIDNTLGNDERLDFGKVEFAAVGFADAVPEPTSSTLTDGETRETPSGPPSALSPPPRLSPGS